MNSKTELLAIADEFLHYLFGPLVDKPKGKNLSKLYKQMKDEKQPNTECLFPPPLPKDEVDSSEDETEDGGDLPHHHGCDCGYTGITSTTIFQSVNLRKRLHVDVELDSNQELVLQINKRVKLSDGDGFTQATHLSIAHEMEHVLDRLFKKIAVFGSAEEKTKMLNCIERNKKHFQ